MPEMNITHVTPREMELQAEVDRLGAEIAALKAAKPPRLSPEEIADLAAAIMIQPVMQFTTGTLITGTEVQP